MPLLMQPNLLRNRCFLPTKNTKYRTFYRTNFLLISLTCLSRYISLSFYRPALCVTPCSCLFAPILIIHLYEAVWLVLLPEGWFRYLEYLDKVVDIPEQQNLNPTPLSFVLDWCLHRPYWARIMRRGLTHSGLLSTACPFPAMLCSAGNFATSSTSC